MLSICDLNKKNIASDTRCDYAGYTVVTNLVVCN